MAATSRETPAWRVLLDTGDSFKRFVRLEKIVPALVEKKLVNKKLGKYILKEKDTDLLLSTTQKVWGQNEFMDYLEVLIDLSRIEGPQGDTWQFMSIMKGSLEAMKPEPQSRLDTLVRQIVEIVDFGLCGSQTAEQNTKTFSPALSTSTVLSPTSISHIKPPPGQCGDAVSQIFTSDGGVLYSPIHGVTVTIPPNAIPIDFGRFFLSMHIYLHHPFVLTDDTVPCSVIVWFYHNPYFEFLKDVTIEIPHAATADSSALKVVTWGEDRDGPLYKLDTEVPADFSDGYHAVFKVQHFSPYGASSPRRRTSSVRKRRDGKKKKLGTVRRHTMSELEHSLDSSGTAQNSSNLSHANSEIFSLRSAGKDETDSAPDAREHEMRYELACCLPVDRSGAQWEAMIAACYSNPTGKWVLQQLMRKVREEQYGSRIDVRCTSCQPYSDNLELDPQSWSDIAWSVFATEVNVIPIEDITNPALSKHEFNELVSSKLYPPSVTYSVQCSSHKQPTPSTLRCRINVLGARALNGSTPYFILTSSSEQKQRRADRVLMASSYLFKKDGSIIKALTSSADLILDSRNPDHVKFLADISLQMADPVRLGQALQLPQSKVDQIKYECEQISNISFCSYKMLSEWVSSKGRLATLSSLKKLLSATGIKGITVMNIIREQDTKVLLDEEFDDHLFPNICSSQCVANVDDEVTFVLKLSSQIRCCWQMVGSLMGIPLVQLDGVASRAALDVASTPAYDMLLEWQKNEGKAARYGTVFKAIQCMFGHYASVINHAHWYATQFVCEVM